MENYLNEEDEKDEENESIDDIELNEHESDKENQPFTLNNTNRQTRPKGRPKGTKRIKASYEKNITSSTINRQYKCGICGDMGHNKRNCSTSRT